MSVAVIKPGHDEPPAGVDPLRAPDHHVADLVIAVDRDNAPVFYGNAARPDLLALSGIDSSVEDHEVGFLFRVFTSCRIRSEKREDY